MKKYSFIAVLVAFVFFGSSAVAFAASDYFLKLDGIEGESTSKGHAKEIDIQSWSWGMSNSGSSGTGGGGGAGKVSFSDISFMKSVDKSSPALFKACATGKHIDKATLTVRNSDGQDYLHYQLENVLCTSLQQSGGGDAPTESLSLNYEKFKIEYQQPTRKGLGEMLSAGWDIVRNIIWE